MRRQMRRHSSRRSSSRRRLGRLWNRLFHRPRVRGQIPLLTPAHTSQTTLGDGIVNPSEGTVRSPAPSSEGPGSEANGHGQGQAGGLQEAGCSSVQPETEITEPSPSDVLANPCTAAEPEVGRAEKPLGADTADSEPRQSSKVDSGKAFRDPLSESVTETIHGGSAARRTVPEDSSFSRGHLLSEEPCGLPSKKWESAYPGSPMHVHIPVDGQTLHCPNSFREEPLGIHAACCHSVEVPVLESSTPLSEINTSDDESLLVC